MTDFETMVKIFDKSKTPYKYKKEKNGKDKVPFQTLWITEQDHGCGHSYFWCFKFKNGELVDSCLGEDC